MIHSHKFSYEQYLDRVQRRGSQNAKVQLCKLLKHEHIRTELTVAILLVFAAVTYLVGLHIAPVACLAIAVVILSSDIYDKFREHRAGF